MRKLFWTASALALLALAACGDKGASTGPTAAGSGAPPPPAASDTPAPEPRPQTETASVHSGAYGMPAAPVPYDQMTAYEQQAAASGAAARPNGPGAPVEAPQPTKTKSDNVFY